MAAKTETIYKTIIDRLITDIKDEFIKEGCSEETLKELRTVSISNFLIFIKIIYYRYGKIKWQKKEFSNLKM